MVTFTSHPTQKFRLAGFQFEKGVLELEEGPDLKRFRTILAGQPLVIQNSIREISVDEGDRIAKAFKAGRMIQGIDTTANSVEASAAFDGQHTPESAQIESAPPADEPTEPLKFGKKSAE